VVPRSKSLDADKNSFYVPKNQITRELLARYNDINPEKLREGVYIVGNNPLAAIDNKCVIAAMIRLNAASLGVDVSKLPPENTEGFFGIDRRVPEACLARYDEEQNVGFHDMRNLEITMTRLDSPKDWANPAGAFIISSAVLFP
jgi:hypothetical protein